MALDALRGELRELNRQRESLEHEMEALSEALSADNMGGVSGPLVDREGFPRADVDVHATRTMRHRLACLNTDHTELMKLLETKLHALHAAIAESGALSGNHAARDNAPAAQPPRAMSNGTSASPPIANGSASADEPFARFASVNPAGPAAMAGLQAEDELVRYGHVDASNHDNLRAIARLTGRSEGGYIPLVVRRAGRLVEVTLAPQRWEGQGLLGCHLVPL